MPLKSRIARLNRTNTVPVLLESFQANASVKALIFMPGATDELYLFKRAAADLTNTAPTLLDAVSALTNQTLIRATFLPPFLLLHTDEDPITPLFKIEDDETAGKIRSRHPATHLLYNDRDWDYVHYDMRKPLRIEILPGRRTNETFHFYRHSFAAWNLNGFEMLEAVSLAGKTTFTIERNRIVFRGDTRVRALPKLDGLPGTGL